LTFNLERKFMSLLKVSLTLVTFALAASTPAFAAEPTSTNDINQTTIIDGSNSSYQTQQGGSNSGSRTPAISQKTDQSTDIQANRNHASNTKQVVGGATQRRGR
jgi:hypothetical protein